MGRYAHTFQDHDTLAKRVGPAEGYLELKFSQRDLQRLYTRGERFDSWKKRNPLWTEDKPNRLLGVRQYQRQKVKVRYSLEFTTQELMELKESLRGPRTK